MGAELFRTETLALLSSLNDYLISIENQLTVNVEQEKQGQIHWQDSDYPPPEPKIKYIKSDSLTLERILRYSFVATLFLVIENQLVELCRKAQVRNGLPAQNIGKQGRILELSKKFLTDTYGDKVLESDWNAIQDISIIRNCVVHALGKISTIKERYKQRISDIADANIGLELGYYVFKEHEVIVISSNYCFSILKTTQIFFENLLDTTGF